MSTTQHANDAGSSRLITGEKATLPRPHLVAAGDKRLHHDFSEAGFESETTLELNRAQAFEQHLWVDSLGHFVDVAMPSTSLHSVAKRMVDLLGSLLLVVVFSPLVLMLPFLMQKGGGIIYRHRRVGCNGQMFECLKFRTMVPNADEVLRELLEQRPELKAEWVRDRKLRRDPRVTRLGHFLRRTSLDELPQIWNVLRGEMSLVGPRPVVREELLRYGSNAAAYLAAKPGITGLWQVTGRNDTDYRRRVDLDTYYVCNQNLLLDVYILIKTTRVVLGGSGAY